MIDFNLSAVFTDRDGVLNQYVRGDYIRVPDELHLLPGAAAALRRLNDLSIPVIIVSNQQGVGKRVMTEDALDQVDGELRDSLLAASGATFVRSYYCVHLAEEMCQCRKPLPGMILQAADEYGLDISRSVMIGDSLTDIEMGNNALVAQSILVMSGATEVVPFDTLEKKSRPTYIARDFERAVSFLLEGYK